MCDFSERGNWWLLPLDKGKKSTSMENFFLNSFKYNNCTNMNLHISLYHQIKIWIYLLQATVNFNTEITDIPHRFAMEWKQFQAKSIVLPKVFPLFCICYTLMQQMLGVIEPMLYSILIGSSYPFFFFFLLNK